jgi:hypothetical protein
MDGPPRSGKAGASQTTAVDGRGRGSRPGAAMARRRHRARARKRAARSGRRRHLRLAMSSTAGSEVLSGKRDVFWVDPASPTVKLGEFQTLPIGGTDAEDLAIDPNSGHLFIVNGIPRTIVKTTKTGTWVSPITLPEVIVDPEALVYDAREQVFYVGGGFSSNIWKVDRSGTIVSTIDILGDFRNPAANARVHVKDLELAPSSDPNDDPGKLNLFVADFGNSHVSDGRLFEINLGLVLERISRRGLPSARERESTIPDAPHPLQQFPSSCGCSVARNCRRGWSADPA